MCQENIQLTNRNDTENIQSIKDIFSKFVFHQSRKSKGNGQFFLVHTSEGD